MLFLLKMMLLKLILIKLLLIKGGNGHVYWKREGITISAGVLQ